jgi:hypothetical protein
MVAYSFKKLFSPQIEDGTKLQTVRGNRARHARPGEMLQLYEAMRTKHCRKIVPDCECVTVEPIEIRINTLLDEVIASIAVSETVLHRDEIEEFSRADGFAPERVSMIDNHVVCKTARHGMGIFWLANHPGLLKFEGQLIRWKAGVLAP